MNIRIFVLSAIIVLSTAVSGCSRVALYQNLSEEDANTILVLLSENGIDAKKKKEIVQNEVSYAIDVLDSDMVRARSLLMKHNLPRRKAPGLEAVYREKGLIPTPDEQKARFLLAVKGEIINSLGKLPNIVDADVVLNIPEKNEFADAETRHRQRPTASVVIKATPMESGTEPLSEQKVQQFVANAVEGMNPRDVAVVITYLQRRGDIQKPGEVMNIQSSGGMARSLPPPVFEQELIGLKLDEESKDRLKIYLLIFFVILVVLSCALIVVIIQGSRIRRQLSSFQQGSAGNYPALEGQVMDEQTGLPSGRDQDEF